MPKIFIDPFSKITYASFYVQGLYDFYGKRNVCFRADCFKELRQGGESHAFDHYMAYVVVDEEGTHHRVIIDYRDKPTIKERALGWADVYAKINLNREATPATRYRAILSIPPGFGVRVWNLPVTLLHCFENLLRCRFRPLSGIRGHVIDYLYQCLRREPLSVYRAAQPQPGYVFHASMLWEHDNCRQTTNRLRKTFMESCRQMPGITFEGGFLARKSHPDYELYETLILSRSYPLAAYLAKCKRSCVVFNTPAVHNCHGWKLGEYLAMRKVIVSTPLSNELPGKLEDGKNILIVEDEKQIAQALGKLFSDPELCRKIASETDAYYERYASPRSVIASIDSRFKRRKHP